MGVHYVKKIFYFVNILFPVNNFNHCQRKPEHKAV